MYLIISSYLKVICNKKYLQVNCGSTHIYRCFFKNFFILLSFILKVTYNIVKFGLMKTGRLNREK